MTAATRFFLAAVCLVATAMPLLAHESPIDHVDRRLQLRVDGTKLVLTYDLRQTQRAALLQLRSIDADNDGRITQKERGEFLERLATRQARLLKIELGGKPIQFQSVAPVELRPDLTQRFVFAADVGQLPKGVHRGRLRDLHSRAYPGSFRVLQDRSTGKVVVRSLLDRTVERFRGHPGMLMLLFEIRVTE